jgi:hypothetical protein
MPTPPLPDEDDLDELPPLDGDGHEEPDAAPDADDLEADDSGEASLDDSTGEDEPPDPSEVDLDENEPGWLDEPAETPDLDLGDVAIVDFGEGVAPTDEAEEPGVGEEDFGLGGAPEHGELDAGDEGPVGGDEELREADLPRLDADEEGELDDAALVEPGFAADEPVGLPWAAEPWPRVGAPVALASATAVACAGRGAIVAGRTEGGASELVRVDLEGTSQGLPTVGLDAAEVNALAADGDRVVAIAAEGRVLVSVDGGARFEPVLDGVVAMQVALASKTLWLRTRSGGLLAWRDGAPQVERCGVPGSVEAMTRDVSSGIVGLVGDDAGHLSALVRVSASGAVAREVLDAPDAAAPAVVAARGPHVAYASRSGGVARRLRGGTWETHAWDGRITGLAFVDDAGTLVAAAYSEADDTTALVRLDVEGRATVVARIGPSGTDGEVDASPSALAHDDARGVVWVAGAFGVAAFAVR